MQDSVNQKYQLNSRYSTRKLNGHNSTVSSHADLLLSRKNSTSPQISINLSQFTSNQKSQSCLNSPRLNPSCINKQIINILQYSGQSPQVRLNEPEISNSYRLLMKEIKFDERTDRLIQLLDKNPPNTQSNIQICQMLKQELVHI